MKTPFLTAEKTAATAEGSTCTCDSRKSQVRVGKVAGAASVSRWCNLGESLVRLDAVAGATGTSRWCDFGESLMTKKATDFEKTAHSSRVDADVCSSSTTNRSSK